MDNICKICNQPFAERSHFWKIHRVKEKDYYEKYWPKQDMLTGEKLEFKNPEQYDFTDFKDKKNLKTYIETNTKDFVLNYLANSLKKRLKIKNSFCLPSEFELKSLQFPTLKYLEKKYTSYVFRELLDLINNGVTKINEVILSKNFHNNELNEINKKLEFIVDSREQSVLDLQNIQIEKLCYGDYSIKNNNDKIYIERKSLTDFIGTLSQGYERFQKELERCKKDNGYLIVLIEEKYSNILGFNYLPHCKRIKASPEFIMHNARELLRLYPFNLQILAVDGRKEAARVINKIFKLEENPRSIDLQYYYDKELL